MLPKLSTPTFSMSIPSTKTSVRYRPFLVKEEKILLMAGQSGDMKDIIYSLKQIVENCLQTPLDVNALTLFDLEYMFLKLRAKSVDNIVKLSYKDTEDGKIYDFSVNLDDIEVVFPENIENTLKIDDQFTLQLKYPTVSTVELFADKESDEERVFKIINACLDKLVENNGTVYEFDKATAAEVEEFVNSLDVTTFGKIQSFLDNQPKLTHTLKYTNKNGNEREIKLEKLRDFFTLG